MAHPHFTEIRERFAFRCGYCGVSEIDAGAPLTVDHFRPTCHGGDDSLPNLVYACGRCNTLKSDFYPSEQEIAAGIRVLHPLIDDMSAHLRLDMLTGRLEPTSVTGRFHLYILDLNREPLVAHRYRDILLAEFMRNEKFLAAKNQGISEGIRINELFLNYLRLK